MLGSVVLETAIGLSYLYLTLSLICMVLNEWIAGLFALRARTLEFAIGNLLDNAGPLSQSIYNHPLIKGLGRKDGGGPSYIPARTFATALLDSIAPADAAGAPKSLQDVRDLVGKLPPGDARTALLALIDQAHGNVDRARLNVENWYNDAMDRASGWYKRRAHAIIVCLAAGVVLLLNADTFAIANGIGREPALLASISAAAQQAVRQPLPADQKPSPTRVKDLQTELQQIQIPLGWSLDTGSPQRLPNGFLQFVVKLLGLAFTGVAVSLGAPFWFDLLGRLVSLRASGDRPGKPEP